MAGRLFAALALGRADGRYPKMLRALSRADLLRDNQGERQRQSG